ncbi:MAG: histidine phosphatase family protein [Granulosicoccus sp.]
MNKKFLALGYAICLTFLSVNGHASEDSETDKAWRSVLQGTAIAIMRHALAPGTGDPTHFELDDCTTQRNLSDEGRAQASAIGDLFREKGIATAQVITSEWCRCRETARLLELGPPEPFAPLNSFFQNRQDADEQTRRLREAMPNWLQPGSTPTVLVTHQVNISALTGNFTSSGEILIISLVDERVDVMASIATLD